METSGNMQVTDRQKEATAILVMRTMLTKYAVEKNLPFEEVLLQFSQSRTYEMLFDYETEAWKEGPDYLRALYDEECREADGSGCAK